MNVHCPTALFPLDRALRGVLAVLTVQGALLGAGQLHAQEVDSAKAPIATGADPVAATVNSDMDGKTMGYILLAELSARRGDFEGAVGYYYQIAKEVKRDELFEKAVQYALAMKSVERVTEAGRAWTQTMPNSSKAAVYWFTITIRTQPIERSYEALRLALEKSDTETRRALMRELPHWYGENPPLPATLKALERVLAPYLAAPQTTLETTLTLAHLRLAAADIKSATALFQSAAALNARHPHTVELAAALLPLDPERLKPWFVEQIRLQADSGTLLAFVRWQAEQEGPGFALDTLQEAWQQNPNNPAVGLLLARYQMAALRWGSAKATLERSHQLDLAYPKDSATNNTIAVSQEIRLRLAEIELMQVPPGSIDEWLEGVTSNRFETDILRLRLLEALGKGDLNQAAQWLAQAPAPTEANPWNKDEMWSEVLRQSRYYPAALAHIERRRAASPKDKTLLLSRSILLEEMGNTGAALEQLRHLHQRDPGDPLVQNALGFTLADHRLELEWAKELITQANAGKPSDPMIMDSLGWVEYRLGHLERAEQWLSRAHARDPHPEIAMHLGEVLWMQNHKEKAIKVFSEAFDPLVPYSPLVKTLQRLGVKLP